VSALADIAVVMPTCDRTPSYFVETLYNLQRAGLWASPRFHSFTICRDDVDDNRDHVTVMEMFSVRVRGSASALLPCENAGRALVCGSLLPAPWVLYLEDDIDVCADFLDSVGDWLDDHANPAHRVYAFGAAYTPQIEAEIARGSSAWEYPVHAFYGTQAIALRAEDARSLGEYWQSNPMVRGVSAPGQYDLMLQDWLRNRYADGRILASCPSMVAHLGHQSSIRPEDPSPPVFDSWRGRDWRYMSHSRAILVP